MKENKEWKKCRYTEADIHTKREKRKKERSSISLKHKRRERQK